MLTCQACFSFGSAPRGDISSWPLESESQYYPSRRFSGVGPNALASTSQQISQRSPGLSLDIHKKHLILPAAPRHRCKEFAKKAKVKTD